MGEYHRQKTAHCGRFLLLIVFFYSSKRKPAYFVFFSLISSLYQDHLNAELERKPNMPFFNTLLKNTIPITPSGIYLEAVKGLCQFLDGILLFIARMGIEAAYAVNKLRYYLHGEFLLNTLEAVFKALGLTVRDGYHATIRTDGLFFLAIILAFMLLGVSYVVSVIWPNATRLVNVRNLTFNTLIAIIIVGSSFTVLREIDYVRLKLFEGINRGMLDSFGLENSEAWKESTIRPVCYEGGTSNVGDDLPWYFYQSYCPPYNLDSTGNPVDLDGVNCSASGGSSGNKVDDHGISCGFNSTADYLGPLIGVKEHDDLRSAGFIPDNFYNTFFPESTHVIVTSDYADRVVNNRYLPSVGVAFAGALLAGVAICEAIVQLMLDLASVMLFIVMPLGIILSYFSYTSGYFGQIVEKYIQIIVISIVIATLMPVIAALGFNFGGYLGYIICSGLAWGAALIMVFRPFLGAIDFAINGAFTSIGLASLTDSAREYAGKTLGTVAGLGTAAATGGIAAGLGAIAGASGLLSKGLRQVGTGKATISPFVTSMAENIQAKSSSLAKKSATVASFAAGAGLSQFRVGQIATTLGMLRPSGRGDLSLGETLQYADRLDAFVSGATFGESGSLTSAIMQTERLKEKARTNLMEKVEDDNPQAVIDIERIKQRGRTKSTAIDLGNPEVAYGRYGKMASKLASELLERSAKAERTVFSDKEVADGVEISRPDDRFKVVNTSNLRRLLANFQGLTTEEKKKRRAILEEAFGEDKADAMIALTARTTRDPSGLIDVAVESWSKSIEGLDASDEEHASLLQKIGIEPNWMGVIEVPDDTKHKLKVSIQKIISKGGSLDLENPAVMADVIKQAQITAFGDQEITEAESEIIHTSVKQVLVDQAPQGRLSVPSQNLMELSQKVFQEALQREIDRVGPEQALKALNGNGSFSNAPIKAQIEAVMQEKGYGHVLADSQLSQQLRDAWDAMSQVEVNLSGVDVMFEVFEAVRNRESPLARLQETYGLTQDTVDGDFGAIVSYYAQNPEPEVAPIYMAMSDLDVNEKRLLKSLTDKIQNSIQRGINNNDYIVKSFVAKRGDHIPAAQKILQEMARDGEITKDEYSLFKRLVSNSARLSGVQGNSGLMIYRTVELLRGIPTSIPVKANLNDTLLGEGEEQPENPFVGEE